MRKLITLITVLALTGCATNGEFDGGKTALLIGGIIVAGIALSQQSDSGTPASNCYWVVGPNGSTQVCDR